MLDAEDQGGGFFSTIEARHVHLHRQRFGVRLVLHQRIRPRPHFDRLLGRLRSLGQALRRVGEEHPAVEVVGIELHQLARRREHQRKLILRIVRRGHVALGVAVERVLDRRRLKQLERIVRLVGPRGDHTRRGQRDIGGRRLREQRRIHRRNQGRILRGRERIRPRQQQVRGVRVIRCGSEQRLEAFGRFTRHRHLLGTRLGLGIFQLAHRRVVHAAVLQVAVRRVVSRILDHMLPVHDRDRTVVARVRRVGHHVVRIRIRGRHQHRALREVIGRVELAGVRRVERRFGRGQPHFVHAHPRDVRVARGHRRHDCLVRHVHVHDDVVRLGGIRDESEFAAGGGIDKAGLDAPHRERLHEREIVAARILREALGLRVEFLDDLTQCLFARVGRGRVTGTLELERHQRQFLRIVLVDGALRGYATAGLGHEPSRHESYSGQRHHGRNAGHERQTHDVSKAKKSGRMGQQAGQGFCWGPSVLHGNYYE